MGHSLVLTKMFIRIYVTCLHSLKFFDIVVYMRNLGRKVCKKWKFIISARDGVKPVIKQENSTKSGNVGISVSGAQGKPIGDGGLICWVP